MYERTLVTCALPYANGPVHMGHIAGVYLPGDIYVKYLRLKGEDCIFVCGTDEHGVPITISADQENARPQEIVARYHAMQEKAFQGLGIEFDVFSGTSTCPHHQDFSQDFFLRLLKAGHIEPRVTAQYYCTHCERFLPDRYVEGSCPYCDSEDARGDQCESCGRALDALKDPKCKVCGRRPEQRQTKHWFFRLDKYEGRLKEWLATKSDWKENVRNFVMGMLEKGLKPRAITRDLSWGLPVPVDDAEGKVLYVWFDAPIGYISFSKEMTAARGDENLWKKYWRDDKTRLVHFIGKDNIVFHAVIWPAMLMGQQADYVLPAEIPAFEFLNYRGGKFSKSKKRALWVHEYLENYPADLARFYLTAIAPENRDTNWTWEDFVIRVNTELADVVGNFVNRTFTFTHRFFDGNVPVASAAQLDEPLAAICKAREAFDAALGAFRFKDALKAMIDLAREGNRYFDKREPWAKRKSDPDHAAVTLRGCLEIAAGLSVIGWPILPQAFTRVRRWIGLDDKPDTREWNRLGKVRLEEGNQVQRPEILFKKLDLKTVLRQEGEEPVTEQKPSAPAADKQAPEQAPKAEKAKPATPGKIPFDRFMELDLRVAEILSVEKVRKADKLYKLEVDIGDEKRTMVAGLAQYYPDPEALVGKKVVVVVNLEPAKIRGVKSEAMLLAAQHEEVVAVVAPEKDLPPGSKVR